MATKTPRQWAAAIGGAASWDRNRPQKLADATKGGLATLERYGRAHYYRMAYLRWGRRANANSRVRDHAKCPLRVARQPEAAGRTIPPLFPCVEAQAMIYICRNCDHYVDGPHACVVRRGERLYVGPVIGRAGQPRLVLTLDEASALYDALAPFCQADNGTPRESTTDPDSAARVVAAIARKMGVAAEVHSLLAADCPEDCACYQQGREQAQRTVGDWHRPAGA